jgi:large subunit ribosomal protein L29
MKISEFRTKNKQELTEELKKMEKDLKEIVTQIMQGKEKNIMKTRVVRKDIARVKTLINEKKVLDNGAK